MKFSFIISGCFTSSTVSSKFSSSGFWLFVCSGGLFSVFAFSWGGFSGGFSGWAPPSGIGCGSLYFFIIKVGLPFNGL